MRRGTSEADLQPGTRSKTPRHGGVAEERRPPRRKFFGRGSGRCGRSWRHDVRRAFTRGRVTERWFDARRLGTKVARGRSLRGSPRARVPDDSWVLVSNVGCRGRREVSFERSRGALRSEPKWALDSWVLSDSFRDRDVGRALANGYEAKSRAEKKAGDELRSIERSGIESTEGVLDRRTRCA